MIRKITNSSTRRAFFLPSFRLSSCRFFLWKAPRGEPKLWKNESSFGLQSVIFVFHLFFPAWCLFNNNHLLDLPWHANACTSKGKQKLRRRGRTLRIKRSQAWSYEKKIHGSKKMKWAQKQRKRRWRWNRKMASNPTCNIIEGGPIKPSWKGRKVWIESIIWVMCLQQNWHKQFRNGSR